MGRRRGGIDKPEWERAIQLARQSGKNRFFIEEGAVVFEPEEEKNRLDQEQLRKALLDLYPWRKGPFRIHGVQVDASWKSERKWERLQRIFQERDPDVRGGTIADVGANNGYYMFRMMEFEPRLIVGIDPVPVMHGQFQFLHSFYPHPALQFARAGFEHLDGYPGYFDMILNMGILYHHTDPVDLLRRSAFALRPGGLLILETMGFLPVGEDPGLCLFPSGKYTGANGIWFVPSPVAIQAMLTRAGFQDIRRHEISEYGDEQGESPFSRMHGPASFLDPEDSCKTLEGYPAPVRILFSATI